MEHIGENIYVQVARKKEHNIVEYKVHVSNHWLLLIFQQIEEKVMDYFGKFQLLLMVVIQVFYSLVFCTTFLVHVFSQGHLLSIA